MWFVNKTKIKKFKTTYLYYCESYLVYPLLLFACTVSLARSLAATVSTNIIGTANVFV